MRKLDYVFNKIIRLLSLSEHNAAPSEDNGMLKRHPYKRNFYATFYGLTYVLVSFLSPLTTPAESTARSGGKNTNQSIVPLTVILTGPT